MPSSFTLTAKKAMFLLLLLTLALALFAQEKEMITVKSGEDIAAVLSSYGMYRLPSFTSGMVRFRDGTSAGGKMNYNIFLGDLQFIDGRGDTLSVANPETIDSAVIDTSLFYYKNGYLEVIKACGGYTLARKQSITFRPVKLGAYGNQSPGSSIESYGRVNNAVSPYVNNNRLTLNEDIVVIISNSYFLCYKKFRQEKASRQGFLLAFPAKKEKIDDFISAAGINFNREADLARLLVFCTALAE